MSWLARHDIKVDAVIPDDFEETGRGMRATRDIAVILIDMNNYGANNCISKAWRSIVEDPRVFNYIRKNSIRFRYRAIVSRGNNN